MPQAQFSIAGSATPSSARANGASRPGGIRDRSIGFKLGTIVVVYVGIIGALLAALAAALSITNGVRAYVAGEGLWSKGQKDALYYLMRYARSHDPEHYVLYQRAIAIPLGDHAARLELEQPRYVRD